MIGDEGSLVSTTDFKAGRAVRSHGGAGGNRGHEQKRWLILPNVPSSHDDTILVFTGPFA